MSETHGDTELSDMESFNPKETKNGDNRNLNKRKIGKEVVGIAFNCKCSYTYRLRRVGKIKHIQNKKILLVHGRMQMQRKCLPFKKNGGLVVNKDMPELGITCGNALHSISSQI